MESPREPASTKVLKSGPGVHDEVAHAVVVVPERRAQIPAQAEVQREVLGHLPVVLDVETVVALAQVADGGRGDGGAGGDAEQQVGESVAGARPALRILRVGAAEGEAAARAAGRERIADDEADVGAGLDGVAAVDDGNAVGESASPARA